MSYLSAEFIQWLSQHADDLDQSNQYADELLTRLANEGIFKIGVPSQLGGSGGTIQDAIHAIQSVSQISLTAGFISWGHRTLIENLLASSNSYPKEQWLADLLSGKRAGGTGLSNAVKFLSGIEELQVTITHENGKYYLNGRLPWVTNLRQSGFITIFVASYADNSKAPIIIALPSIATGLTRTKELSLIGLQGSNTVALHFENVELDPNWIIAEDASSYLVNVRPAFLGLQCAMAFGLAQRSLNEVKQTLNSNRSILQTDWENLTQQLTALQQRLAEGLADPSYFVQHPKVLFQIRIEIVDIVVQSLTLELQASGGRGYLTNGGTSFIRRWREGAFLPVVTPSVLQLKTILQAVN
ncbi:acyl-CoA dehydrogenase family protein [Glaesserella parasuis]|uniref:Acyl-CoA dehydrogenase n=4 Tax=Glaesserella parasuis TaxID=738 RepID=A0A6I5WPC1_GLAPU|nr:acyl-CoA dehydrogenase family protein [Glaesserella parasuis]AGO16255.1 acyl-CoA dehydrogenase [Glaesserella parasuis ZJ0906]AIK89658.1 dehydrogenase [Glaesserella parasuis]ATW45677.1 dehydrogenase [Glaesserella parasuis str. Nagasaki]AWY45767.1 acyl-CoA dehydrogenase [Glaesserella parasuis 29755]EQA04004.1 acyl-CoA dehydrogenase, N-terminal domain protein [Glaesserella parasuis str. Nagasaki]